MVDTHMPVTGLAALLAFSEHSSYFPSSDCCLIAASTSLDIVLFGTSPFFENTSSSFQK